jgi:hypothetical protein
MRAEADWLLAVSFWQGSSNLFSATFGGLLLSVLLASPPSIWLICSLPVFSNSASFWPRSAGGSSRIVSLVGLGSSPSHLLPKRQQIDRSRFMLPSSNIETRLERVSVHATFAALIGSRQSFLDCLLPGKLITLRRKARVIKDPAANRAVSATSAYGTSATFTRRGAMSEVHSEADISRIADPAA